MWLCLVASLLVYMVQRGNRAGPLFMFSEEGCFVTALQSTLFKAGIDDKQYAGHNFELVRQPQQLRSACRIPSSRHSAAGAAVPTPCT